LKPLYQILPLVLLSAASFLSQAVEIVPGDNLVLEGIPKIPSSLAEEVGRYTEFRSAMLLSWHPTQREMLISTRFGDTPQIHQVKFPGGARTQLTFYPDRVGGGSYQPRKGDNFVFSKDVGGNEFFQAYRYDMATGNVTLLTDGKSRNTGGVWSNAGDWFAYGSTRRNGKDVDLYVINPSDPKSNRMLAQLEGGGWQVVDWSPDDRQVLVVEYISINESYLWLVDVGTGEKTLLTPKGGTEQVAYPSGKFSKDGKGLYVITDKGSEFHRLAYMDLAGHQASLLTSHISWDVEDFDLTRDGRRIAFLTNEEGISRLHLLETKTGKELTAPKLPIGVIFGIEWHKNGRDLGFSLVSARSTSDVYSLDLDTGKVERWTASETGGINTENFSEPELIRWKSFDGRMLSGFLYPPSAKFTGKRPVVINIHGGPEGQARPGFLGRDNYYLNELGVAMIYPNVRGSSGYGKTFLKLDNGFSREDAYKDIGALLDWIETRPELDAGRILVTGGSYGGHMTFAVATLYSDRIRAALPVVGMSNLVTFLERTEGYRRDLRRVEYGDERDPKMREFLERIAPLNNARKITTPLFIVQGGNDPRVPRTEAEQMVATVRQNGTPVWYLMAKDEGHGFAKKKNADFQFYATVLFVKEYVLKGLEP
jgi:dipeptidyl aminopeptidase/acylaminoacyl peptidase